MLPGVNVEQKILALESLLEKVRTNAAKPRTSHGATIATTTAASRPTDDVAGPAVAAAPLRVPPAVTPGSTKFGDDDWSDTTETFDTPFAMAAPLPGPAKDAAAKAPATTAAAKPGPAKPAPIAATTKPVDAAPAKPAVATPAKPIIAAPAIKPVVTTPAVKPLVTPATAKPATPQAAPIPLTNKVAAPIIKTPAVPIASKLSDALKPADTATLNKTLTGVGDNAVKAPDIRAGAIAAGITLPTTDEPPPVEAINLEAEKKPAPTKAGLPSVIADSDGEEDAEPTQLYEASAASIRASELAALAEKQLEEAKKSLGIDKKSDSDKVDIRLPESKDAPSKIEVDAPKLDLPWVEKSERKIDPQKIGLPIPEDKLPEKAPPSRTQLDLELVASQEGSIENVDLEVAEPKAETKPATPVVSEDKPEAKPEVAPISEKKPVVQTKPVAEKKPLVEVPVLEKPTPPSKGVPTLLIVAAIILMLAAGAFVAMQQGWIGSKSTPTPTVAPPTNPTPTATQTAAPTATQTAQPPPTTDTAAPAVSASAAPADSAAAPADSASAAPADSAAAPPTSAAAEPPTAPATPGTPSVDPATLNNNQGLIFVTSNKPARVYLTGKLAGDTNTELKTDCGLKFVRLADPAQDIAKPPIWLTPGQPQQIDCRKYTTFAVTVP